MQVTVTTNAGDHMCLVKAYGSPNWSHECTTSYDGCMMRAEEIMTASTGRSVMIVSILAIANPSMEPVWTSALGEKITKG